MYLSYRDIEKIADTVMHDFNAEFYGNTAEAKEPHPTPIEQLAVDYLNLTVKAERLCSDGSICGITAYSETELETSIYGYMVRIPVRQNEVFLDISFSSPAIFKGCAESVGSHWPTNVPTSFCTTWSRTRARLLAAGCMRIKRATPPENSRPRRTGMSGRPMRSAPPSSCPGGMCLCWWSRYSGAGKYPFISMSVPNRMLPLSNM